MVLGSVIGRRVGGSSGVSPGGGDKARPEGSRVGGGVDLQSSRNEKRKRISKDFHITNIFMYTCRV